MHWLNDYKIFLLDFDGLLVNTEKIHLKAYKTMCQRRGFDLPFDLLTFCHYAHFSATKLKETIYALFPALYAQESRWEVLYAEKTKAYVELLSAEEVELMPGVEVFLRALEQKNTVRCVVTNSTREQIALVKANNALLNSIPHYITREDYSKPKPDAECYRMAMQRFAPQGEKAVGFEDSSKGLTALASSGADPVLVSSLLDEKEVTDLKAKIGKPFRYFNSFESL